jgi:hypothetical protein
MMAVGWIWGIAGAAFYSSRIIAANSASATSLPSTLASPRNFQTVPRLAEPRVVDGHEIDELALGVGPQRVDDDDRGGLRHRLDDEHAGHHRPLGEMPLEMRLVNADVLNPDGAVVRHHVDDLVDEQEGIAMRDHRHDAPDIDGGYPFDLLRRVHRHSPLFLTSRCSAAT